MKKILFAIFIVVISTTLIFGQKNFEDKRFGFSMQQPKNWLVTGREEVTDNIERMDFTEEDLAKLFKNKKQVIFLTAFVKYNFTEHEGLIPKIQIDVLPHNTKNFPSFKSAIIKNAHNFKNIITGYEITKEPEEIDVSGIKSVVFSGKLTVQTQDGVKLESKNRILSIPHKVKGYFFQISFVDGQTEEDNTKLFDELIKTIKIGN